MQATGLLIASSSVPTAYPGSQAYQSRPTYAFDSNKQAGQQRIGNYLILGKLAEGGQG